MSTDSDGFSGTGITGVGALSKEKYEKQLKGFFNEKL